MDHSTASCCAYSYSCLEKEAWEKAVLVVEVVWVDYIEHQTLLLWVFPYEVVRNSVILLVTLVPL